MPKLDDAAGALLEADARTVQAVQPYADFPLFERLADMGDQPQMRVLCAALIGAGVLARDRRLLRAGVRMLAAHTLATWGKDFVKHRIDRTRPRSLDGEPSTDHRLAPGRSEEKEETSFPSGHAAGAAAVARAFAREYPEHSAPASAAGAVLALAQIPRCAHYPTDVGAGLAIGLAAEAAVDGAFRLIRVKRNQLS
ncbi:MAG TPA: phosphatase PAP2 family protein [Allosphingosinicella sp.]|jgi:undecaprenyl-diphosphatase